MILEIHLEEPAGLSASALNKPQYHAVLKNMNIQDSCEISNV